MNDHNLDDLIVDNLEPSNNKTKSILTIVALLIVILIVGIIFTKIFYDSEENQASILDDNRSMATNELNLKIKEKEKKDEIPAPHIESIIDDTPNVAEEPNTITKTTIDKKVEKTNVKTPKIEKTIAEEVVAEKKIVKEKIVKKVEKIKKVEKVTIPEVEPIETVKITKEFEQHSIKKEKIVKKVAPIKKEIVAKIKEPSIPKPVKIHHKESEKKTYKKEFFYIQVGSFTKTPSSKFLSTIKRSGFNYKITNASSKGTKKLLIGPYYNRGSVNSALPKVRDRINKSAFVVKR